MAEAGQGTRGSCKTCREQGGCPNPNRRGKRAPNEYSFLNSYSTFREREREFDIAQSVYGGMSAEERGGREWEGMKEVRVATSLGNQYIKGECLRVSSHWLCANNRIKDVDFGGIARGCLHLPRVGT